MDNGNKVRTLTRITKGKLLSVGEGMGLYVCIAQVALEGSSRKVF